MSIRYIVYDSVYGTVKRDGACGDTETALSQAKDGEVVDVSAPIDVFADGLWQWTSTGYIHNAPPDPTLDELKAQVLAGLAGAATPKFNLWQGGSAPAGGLQVDDVSTGRMTSWASQALVCKMTGATFDLPYWVMADNSHHAFSGADDFLAFASAAAAYKTAAILNNSVLKAAIRSAADQAALDAVDITKGWPA